MKKYTTYITDREMSLRTLLNGLEAQTECLCNIKKRFDRLTENLQDFSIYGYWREDVLSEDKAYKNLKAILDSHIKDIENETAVWKMYYTKSGGDLRRELERRYSKSSPYYSSYKECANDLFAAMSEYRAAKREILSELTDEYSDKHEYLFSALFDRIEDCIDEIITGYGIHRKTARQE